jgi:hypothetical protein
MQPFYPSPLKQRLAPALLLLLVVCLHLAGLQSISTLWPTQLHPGQTAPLQMTIDSPAGEVTPVAPAPKTSNSQALAKPKPLSPVQAAVPMQGLHAVKVTDDDKSAEIAQIDKVQDQPEHPLPEPVSLAVPETDARAVLAAAPAAGSAPVVSAPPADSPAALPRADAAPTLAAAPPLVPEPAPATASAVTETPSATAGATKLDNAAATAPAATVIAPSD